MKDTKRKVLVKAAKKEAKKNIHNSLIAELEKVVGSISPLSGKLKKVIAKGSEKLAKKLAKEIHLDEAAIAAGAKPVATEKAAPAPKAAEAPAKKLASKKGESKKPAAKTETVVTAS